MNVLYVLGACLFVIMIYIFLKYPNRMIRFFSFVTIRLTVGILLLFFLNVVGGLVGIHIPINLFTVSISSLLGIYGVATLTAVHLFFL